MNISDTIYKVLENINNVYEGWYREELKETHTTFIIYYTSPTEFEDDDNSKEYICFQIDTWGEDKESVDSQYKKVRKILKENGFCWMESNRDYETYTKIYHYADRFCVIVDYED